MRKMKRLTPIYLLAAVALANGCTSASAETPPLEGSLQYYQARGGGAGGSWSKDQGEQVADMKVTADGDVVGFFIQPKSASGDRAWKISFDIASKGFTKVAGLRPYIHVYSKRDGRTKYEKNLIVPYEKLIHEDLPDKWTRLTWVCRCLAPEEQWDKIIIVFKPPSTEGKKTEHLLLKHLRIETLYQLASYNLEVVRLNAPGDELR